MKKINPIELKIKAKHLALEPAIIKKEEKKLSKFSEGWLTDNSPIGKRKFDAMVKARELHNHRIMKLRVEARGTELARAFLAGKAYSTVEAKRKPEKEYEFQKACQRAKKIIWNYGEYRFHINHTEKTVSELFEEWLKS